MQKFLGTLALSATAALVALGLSAVPASGERLVTSLSNYRVSIASNFTGADLVLFGWEKGKDFRF